MSDRLAPPGVLRLVRAEPNPAGGIDQLFLLQGDAVGAPVGRVIGDPPPPRRGAGAARLRVFHFNDLHNHLTDQFGATRGTHRFSQMVKRVRDARARDDEAVLFLSIGDDHTGTVFDELLGWHEDEFVADAAYRVYSAGGIDCSVLGNHEFDRGSALLAKGIRQDADFPILSANVYGSSHLVAGRDYHPAAIAVSNGLRIGLVGLTTRVETRIGQPGDPDLGVASPVTAVENLLPALEPLVDVMLVLSHCGYGEGEHQSGKSAAGRDIGEADVSIARAAAPLTEKPVAIIGAHTHTRLHANGIQDKHVHFGIPVFQAECNGRFLGEIEIDPSRPEGSVRGVARACLHPIKPRDDGVAPDAPDFDLIEQDSDYDHAFEAAHITPLTSGIDAVLSHEIAVVETEALSFRHAAAERYMGKCALVGFMCDVIVERLARAGFDVDFALINGASIIAGIEPGRLTLGEWLAVMPYPDEIQIVTVTADEVDAILQSNARRILRPEERPDIDVTGFLPRGFLHASQQLSYRIELSSSATEARSHSIRIADRALSDSTGRSFKVAMPAYLALGAFGERWNGRPISGGVPGALPGFDLRPLPRQNTGLVFRNEIAGFIQAAGRIDRASVETDDDRFQISTSRSSSSF